MHFMQIQLNIISGTAWNLRDYIGYLAKQVERMYNFQRNMNRLGGRKGGRKGHCVPVWGIIIAGIFSRFANVL